MNPQVQKIFDFAQKEFSSLETPSSTASTTQFSIWWGRKDSLLKIIDFIDNMPKEDPRAGLKEELIALYGEEKGKILCESASSIYEEMADWHGDLYDYYGNIHDVCRDLFPELKLVRIDNGFGEEPDEDDELDWDGD